VVADAHDAVVYDLDGTLVRLAVDWDRVHRDLSEALEERGLDVGGRGLWTLLDRAEQTGHRDVAEDVIGGHERVGARQSDRLPLAGELPRSVPVGVCSLNCEAACRSALRTHDLASHVDAIVGRDTVERYKPHPRPLRAVIEELGAESARTLFVGDSESDRTTAEAADVDFQWAADRHGNA
jgi:phosphoglycolate phosphatase